MKALQTSRLFKTVAGPGLLFAVSSSALVFVIPHFITQAAFSGVLGVTAVVVAPDLLATWWLFRRLRVQHAVNEARRGATAFAVSAPLALGVGYPLGTLIGGYAELFLGRVFILPVIFIFLAALVIAIPGIAVRLVLHPSGGVQPFNEGSQ
jgi:hypothetical protein